MNGTAGNNTLKFLEVGGEYGWATFLDEVSVHYYIPENLENCTQSNCTQNTTDQNQTINNSTNPNQIIVSPYINFSEPSQ